VALVLIGLAIVAIWVAASTNSESAVGQAPPEWAANAGLWPAHNYDLANTRATKRAAIDSTNVSSLKVKWRFPLKDVGAFGAFASTPVVVDGTVYFQDLSSNVYALDRDTGKLRWRHAFNRPSVGPNGVAYGWGRVYGATDTNAFALDGKSGKLLWSRSLLRNSREGIDMAPQLYDDTVLISTVPLNINSSYEGGALGVVWALDAATGKTKWSFNTISDGAKLWGNPKVNSGGGIWYPPALDSQGRVFLSVANPAPFPGTKRYPNGSSRPGPNLYTDSLVALDGQTGKLLWYRQAVPHDLRDYDLQDPAIITNIPIHGVQTEVVLVAGKMGKVFAYRAHDGKQLWTLSVGKHQNDTGPLPRKPVSVFPGILGGVETPMALAEGRLFVPWLDFPTREGATGIPGGIEGSLTNFEAGRGGFTAVDAASGKMLWQRKLPSMDFGAATVANDVVFTSTYDGTIYAFHTKTGKTLWTTKARAGINSFPAIDGDTLLIGAGTTGFFKKPHFELVAYRLASARTAPSAGAGAATTVQVKGGEFFFHLSKTSAPRGTVVFVFKNVGYSVHDFEINGKQTPLVQPGGTATLVVTFTKTGSYPYRCTIPGHSEAGMKGVFTVR
jgi:alcohol dehydrogenase (cytochrome c)